ncbi:unnamed protein product [Ectocarpus sp. CCAP 1310/34]|nr:unnamed protein product [Ectocarpus sp. CCAP 1310/34]
MLSCDTQLSQDTLRADDSGDSFKFSMELGSFTFAPASAVRGDSISVDDYLPIPDHSCRRHRLATNDGEAMGVPVHLAKKNGRWRVGRGWMCTLGRSPKVARGWRVQLPWDSHGKTLKAASLQLRDSSVVMTTEDGHDHILWSSSRSPQKSIDGYPANRVLLNTGLKVGFSAGISPWSCFWQNQVQGDIPAYPTDNTPLWAYRPTGSVGGTANGGLGCAVEGWWERATNGGRDMGVLVHLAMKNSRWRVGRGRMCTLGQSPRPAGGWRVHLPWDSHGKTLKAASLQLRDGSVVMSTEDAHILWSSSPSL